MKIFYSDEDAIKIEQVFCGVRLSHIERGKVHALRVFAKND